MHDEEQELSARARARLEDLRFVGTFREADAAARDCQLIEVVHGADAADEHIELQWLLDSAGFIRDARFRSPATGLLLVAYDLMAELCVGITVEQAAVISPAHVAERLRLVYDQDTVRLPWKQGPPFPVISKAVARARGALPEEVHEEEKTNDDSQQAKAAEWQALGLFERVRRIEAVLDQRVRPMLASDGGGCEIVDLREHELVIQYNGACGSCSSSIGGTLQFLTDSLEEELGVSLQIIVQGLEYENVFGL